MRDRNGRVDWKVLGLLVVAAVGLLALLGPDPKAPPPVGPLVRELPGNPAAPPDEVRLDVGDHYPGRIEGRVLRGGKGAVAELTLRLFTRFHRNVLRHAVADPSGHFAFDRIPPGEHELTALGEDGAGVRQAVAVHIGIDRVDLEIHLPAGGLELRGRGVHSDGRPFLGEVAACFGARERSLVVGTGADGRFHLTGLPSGWVSLLFRTPGGLEAEGRLLELPHDGETVFVIDHAAKPVRGRVVSADLRGATQRDSDSGSDSNRK